MEKKIITISRQFGSGGHLIGQKIAERIGAKCYDKELIKITAKESGLWEDLLSNMDEKPTNSFLYSVAMDPYSFAYSFDNSNYGMSLNQKAFMATYNTIKKLSEEGSSVFIGRCADYVLRDNPDILRVFVYAPMETRIKNVMERFSDLTEKKAKDQIVKEDKARAAYYNFYTSNKWGNKDSYDICINTGRISTEAAVDIISKLLD